ncbi:MAG: transposase [Methylotenera sp.]|nr:transposase [Methylotenera sp.]
MFKNAWAGDWNGRLPAGDTHQRAREVVRPTGTIMRGKFPSRKNGRMVDHEGLLERDAIILFEASHLVKRYREQPTSICYPDGGGLRRYTPDFELVLGTGEVVIIEVKHTGSLAHENVRHKLNSIEKHYQELGANFLVMTEKVIRQEPRLSNLRQICAGAGRIWPTSAAIQNALSIYHQHFPTTLYHANHMLQQYDLNVYCLFVSGALSIDLTRPITSETTVDIIKENDHAYFWLA